MVMGHGSPARSWSWSWSWSWSSLPSSLIRFLLQNDHVGTAGLMVFRPDAHMFGETFGKRFRPHRVFSETVQQPLRIESVYIPTKTFPLLRKIRIWLNDYDDVFSILSENRCTHQKLFWKLVNQKSDNLDDFAVRNLSNYLLFELPLGPCCIFLFGPLLGSRKINNLCEQIVKCAAGAGVDWRPTLKKQADHFTSRMIL